MKIYDIAYRLISEHRLDIDEYAALIEHRSDEKLRKIITDEAVRLRKLHYGDKVFTRGLIEFTNICKNDCYYCGIRKSNRNADRYRMTKEEIMSCCENGYALGFRTFVLQGGEDSYYSDEMIADIVRTIKGSYPDCAVTLSIGEKSYESYKLFLEAGADRYLLRHETANEEHYKKLHPEEMSLKNRKQCLYNLKDLGYQVGAGFMVGSPGQTTELLIRDLRFIETFQPHMVGIGPFLPAAGTPFHGEPAGSADLTVKLLSIIRLMHPKVLLPATTALGTAEADGRERGILAGANVIMPNLSPMDVRKKYMLYDNKIATGDEAAESVAHLRESMRKIGYQVVTDRGDYFDRK